MVRSRVLGASRPAKGWGISSQHSTHAAVLTPFFCWVSLNSTSMVKALSPFRLDIGNAACNLTSVSMPGGFPVTKTMIALMICCGLFAAEATGAGAAAESGPRIQLVHDRGAHTAPITALAFTPDSKQLVSASEDKTIRVWDLASRQTLRVIRGETGPADFGKIGAIAVAPDGRLLAAAVRPVTIRSGGSGS